MRCGASLCLLKFPPAASKAQEQLREALALLRLARLRASNGARLNALEHYVKGPKEKYYERIGRVVYMKLKYKDTWQGGCKWKVGWFEQEMIEQWDYTTRYPKSRRGLLESRNPFFFSLESFGFFVSRDFTGVILI